MGFPHYRIIGNNYDSFNEKIWAASNAILQGLGDPAAYEREDKYEVEDVLFPLFEKYGVRLIESNVEQDYLLSDTSDIVRRVRRRGWAPGCRIYTYTEKDRTTDIEHEKIIDREKYETLLQEKDLRRTTLKKKRYNFVREGHYFELDHFLSGKKKGKRLLEIEKATKEQVVELPPFLNIIAKVDRKNEEMARIV